jgi:hypothetical protein
VATTPTRRRTSAEAPARKSVKTSLVVDVELHARWSAAASLRGMDRNAFAVECLRGALKGIVIIDRRRSHDLASEERSTDEAN